jgi:diguanylate cyclase (GGDEF)-like protein
MPKVAGRRDWQGRSAWERTVSCCSSKAESPRVLVVDADAARAERLCAVLRERLGCELFTLGEPAPLPTADLVVFVAGPCHGAPSKEHLERFGAIPVIVVTDSCDDRTATEWILAGAVDAVGDADDRGGGELGSAAVRALARARRHRVARPKLPAAAGTRFPPSAGRKSRVSSLVAFLQAAALTDPLTGLANRRALDARLAKLWSDSMRDGQDLSVLMVDLDNFKQTNDRFGHAGGDAVLVALADAMRAQSRKGDLAARLGGDEVVLLLPRADAVQAHAVAERLREDFVARAGLLVRDRCNAPVSVSDTSLSIGVASRLGAGVTSVTELLARADEALYIAKRSGKACTHVFSTSQSDAKLLAM